MSSLTITLLAFTVALCAIGVPLSAAQASNIENYDDSARLNQEALRTAILGRYYLDKLNEMAGNDYLDESWLSTLKAQQQEGSSQAKRGLGPRPLRFG
uniref:Uncharacterized protein n=1 Tax=Plectus sambesii TaxID=2011161 RepID=A0A914X247_9BILA